MNIFVHYPSSKPLGLGVVHLLFRTLTCSYGASFSPLHRRCRNRKRSWECEERVARALLRGLRTAVRTLPADTSVLWDFHAWTAHKHNKTTLFWCITKSLMRWRRNRRENWLEGRGCDTSWSASESDRCKAAQQESKALSRAHQDDRLPTRFPSPQLLWCCLCDPAIKQMSLFVRLFSNVVIIVHT